MSTKSGPLASRNAIVTGAALRVGRSIARELSRAGCNVAIHYNRSKEAANQLAKEVQSEFGVQTIAIAGDLSEPMSAQGILDQAGKALGPISILVNNASIYEDIHALQTSTADLQRNFNIHTITPFLLSRAMFHQLDNLKGSIVNLLDYEVLRPGANRFAYTISKAALANMTRSLAQAFAPAVRVNGLALGAILPPVDNEEIDPQAWVDKVPLQSWGNPQEIGELVVTLSKEPGYINGEIIRVDGGAHLV